MDLKKQPDRASHETVLSAFFAQLAAKEPSLLHFSNQTFFDDLINHRFTLGDTYNTCHKAFSPLAFLPRTHEEITAENEALEFYEEASNCQNSWGHVETPNKGTTADPHQ
jgi:hypothetical protein